MKHKSACKMSFGRKDPSCPRCQELLKGAPVRHGWGHAKKVQEQRLIAAIRNHDCKKSNCGIVCTAFDW